MILHLLADGIWVCHTSEYHDTSSRAKTCWSAFHTGPPSSPSHQQGAAPGPRNPPSRPGLAERTQMAGEELARPAKGPPACPSIRAL